MKKYFFFFFYILSFSFLFAQEENYYFSDITKAQLEMKSYEADTSATAVILHDFGAIQIKRVKPFNHKVSRNSDIRTFREVFPDFQIFNHNRRIKILKKGGFNQGNIEIPYYAKSESIVDIAARVTLPNGKQYNIDKEDILTEKKSEFWSIKKILVPKLEVGSIIDYYYRLETQQIVQLKEWYFQSDIPTIQSELNVNFHKDFSYMYLFQGFDSVNRVKNQGNTVLDNSIAEVITGTKTFKANNIPALKEEPFLTTIDDYRLRIRFQCTQVKKISSKKTTEISSTWQTVTNKVLDNSYFESQYTSTKNCKKILKEAKSILNEQNSTLDKAKALYRFINNNVGTNQSGGIYVETTLNDAFEKKLASKSEMNLMLLALLRKAAIESYPALISTRNNGYPVKDHPIVDQFNQVILLVIIDGKEYFVDQGNKLRPFGELSRNSMNRSAYQLIRPVGKWLSIEPNKSKKIIMSDFVLGEEGKMIGHISANYTNNEATDNREAWINEEEEKYWIAELENTIIDFELDSVIVENERNLNKPFKLHFNGDFSGAVLDIGDYTYINPFIFSDFLDNPFKSETRRYPVDFPHPFSNQFIINIKYDTEDYAVEELPKDAKLELEGKIVTLRYAAQEKAPGWIQVTYAVSVNNPYIPVPAYEGLRTLFDMTAEKLGEQIVLKKL